MLNRQQSTAVPPPVRAIVITGASSGLGRALALYLEQRGFRVFAGVRSEVDGEKLRADASSARLQPMILDVTDEKSIRAAGASVSDAVDGQGLWALVNNAGTCVSAPLECVPPAQLRQQLDINVIGALAVTQALLPQLRLTRGRIVNVSSGLGAVALPYLGAYAAGQFAKEGMSDALRRELRPSGVSVSVVRPGAIMTPLWDKVRETGNETLNQAPDDIAGIYRPSFERFLRLNERRAQLSRTRPEDFARQVFRAVTATRAKSRYYVGTDVRLATALSRLLTDAALDRCLAAATRSGR